MPPVPVPVPQARVPVIPERLNVTVAVVAHWKYAVIAPAEIQVTLFGEAQVPPVGAGELTKLPTEEVSCWPPAVQVPLTVTCWNNAALVGLTRMPVVPVPEQLIIVALAKPGYETVMVQDPPVEHVHVEVSVRSPTAAAVKDTVLVPVPAAASPVETVGVLNTPPPDTCMITVLPAGTAVRLAVTVMAVPIAGLAFDGVTDTTSACADLVIAPNATPAMTSIAKGNSFQMDLMASMHLHEDSSRLFEPGVAPGIVPQTLLSLDTPATISLSARNYGVQPPRSDQSCVFMHDRGEL
jgi:hypothetical protein